MEVLKVIAVVTGGCKGLGENFTKYLLSLGYKVYEMNMII